jgi:arylsulfatase A-like enzyme
MLFVGLSAQDTVSHAYGPESPENLDLLRRLDLNIGRLLDAIEGQGFSRDQVIVALSADHGFAPIPEASRLRDPGYGGGRLVDGDRVLPGFYQRLNRLTSEALCLSASSRPIYGGEGWSMIYNRPALPMRTLEGPCGPEGRLVGATDIDRVLPGVVRQYFDEEVESVLLVSRRASWPTDDRATLFVANDFDAERSGDAFIIPRFGVLMTGDPGRGTGHGTHHAYDTHVPLVFWGGPWPAGSSTAGTTPYDLAPTLASKLGVTLPESTGVALSPSVRAR